MIPTPWIERKFEFNFPPGLFPVILERLRGTVPRLHALLLHIPEEKLCRKKENKWSVKEVVGHLYDLEELWNGRIDDFLTGKSELRPADMSNTKTTTARHNGQPVEVLLQQFTASRNNLIQRVKDIDEVTASLTALHPRLQQPMRLVDSLFFAAEHDDHELAKIRNLLAD